MINVPVHVSHRSWFWLVSILCEFWLILIQTFNLCSIFDIFYACVTLHCACVQINRILPTSDGWMMSKNGILITTSQLSHTWCSSNNSRDLKEAPMNATPNVYCNRNTWHIPFGCCDVQLSTCACGQVNLHHAVSPVLPHRQLRHNTHTLSAQLAFASLCVISVP